MRAKKKILGCTPRERGYRGNRAVFRNGDSEFEVPLMTTSQLVLDLFPRDKMARAVWEEL